MITDSIDQGIPQIPFDLFVKKKCKGVLNITNPFKSPNYVVQTAPSSDRRRIKRVLIDPSGATLISIRRYHDGSWRGFRGDGGGGEDLVFRVERTVNTFDRIEMDVFVVGQDGEESSFKMRGCVFWRSCTIYHGDSIVAQTSRMYTLGFQKIFVSRDKFRITMYPGGFSDYAIVVALVAVFLDGRK